MTFTPTPEQEHIIDLTKNTTDNLLISALAGAAKTSTLVLVAKALQREVTLCLAFNKKIAQEMAERLPGNCTSKTLNAIGHGVWQRHLNKRLTVSGGKNYKILKELIDQLKGPDKETAFEGFNDMKRALAWGKAHGWVPEEAGVGVTGLVTDSEFFSSCEVTFTPLETDLLSRAMRESIQQAKAGTIDFDDQIYMPTLFNARFPQYPLVLVDEAQDLSNINHQMLKKIVKKRLIAVGDECQAIYGFRGANQESMQLLEQEFNMTRAALSVSFRCPRAVVTEARWRAPHMQWPEWAKEGTLSHWDEWEIADLPETATILCRNNAPLFKMAITLLRNGRAPQLSGKDIVEQVTKQMAKFGQKSDHVSIIAQEVEKWKQAKLKRNKDKGAVEDLAACMQIFLSQGEILGDALAYAEHIANAHGPIQLMTGHKSKGLEFPTVFILDRDLINHERNPQDRNLLYVMQTRAQENLYYIETEGLLQ